MKVILNQDVPGTGKKFDVKNVSDGHALNFLIPNGLAQIATPEAIKKVETFKAALQVEKKIQENLLLKNVKAIQEIKITIADKANDKGHLFSGIHKERLSEEIKKQTHVDIGPEFIILEKPIKEIGDHSVEVRVGDKIGKFSVSVINLQN